MCDHNGWQIAVIESNESSVLGLDVPEHQVQTMVHLAVKYQASVQLPEQAQHVAAARPTIDLGIFAISGNSISSNNC